MARKGKRPGVDAIQAALSILEEMSKSDGEVHVMVLGSLFMLTFRAKVKKHAAKGWYKLSTGVFNLNIAPEMSETLVFSENGLFLGREDMGITIDRDEHSTEQLLARYPGAKLIH